jgi:hypothetical protein
MADGLSLRDQLQAAHDEIAARPDETPPAGGEPANEAQGAAGAETGAAAAATPEPAKIEPEPKPAGSAQVRGPDGKFLPKTEAKAAEGAEAAAPPPEPIPSSAEPAKEGPQTEATRIPPALSAAVKAQWSDLPQAVRDEFTRLEDTFQKGKAEWGTKAQRLNRFDELIGPRRERWAMNGLDEFAGIQTLLAAQDVLDREPVQGILHVARSYGVTPAHLAQAFGLTQANGAAPAGAEGGHAPTAAPDINAVLQQALTPLQQQVQTLQRELQSAHQRTEAEQLASAQAEVQAFASDPANLYFDNVRDRVAALIQAGQAKGLSDAYQMAIWADSEIRPLLLKAQTDETSRASDAAAAEQKRKDEEAARTRAAAAQRAAGSVTGAPSPGSEAAGGRSSGNLRQDLEASFREASARA